MLSQIEAPQTSAAVVNAEAGATPIQVAITVTASNGTISFSMPYPVTGVSVDGTSVTVAPGSYALNFTLSGDTFSSTKSGITVNPLPAGTQNVTVKAVEPNATTTATIDVTNTLSSGQSSVTASATFYLTQSGPQDPTIVNDPPQ